MPWLAGCPVTATLPDDAPVRELVVRDTGAKYYLYVPSNYHADRPWPLVVLCHGTNPYDTAWLEMREWAGFAEKNGILVAAPELKGVKGDLPRPAAEQLTLQRQDERTLLGAVAAVRAAYHVAEERIFLTGWSAGGYAVLHTGLRHPEIFRALAVRQGNFDPSYMADVPGRLDRWQPVFVFYGSADFVRDQSRASIVWLRDHGVYVEELSQPGSHRRLPVSIAWDFFRDVYRNRPWIRLGAVAPDYRRPRRVRFSIKASPRAVDARWDFGTVTDAASAAGASGLAPVHEFEADGTYEIEARVKLENGKWYKRGLTVRIPSTASAAPNDVPRAAP